MKKINSGSLACGNSQEKMNVFQNSLEKWAYDTAKNEASPCYNAKAHFSKTHLCNVNF